MTFDFTDYTGRLCHLETTKDGEVHCEPISPEPEPVAMEANDSEEES